ncbi:MAG: LysM peptidoglycan-binding domain-containing protein [Pseudomonadota bacterium]
MADRSVTPLRLVLVLLGVTGLVGTGLLLNQRETGGDTADLQAGDLQVGADTDAGGATEAEPQTEPQTEAQTETADMEATPEAQAPDASSESAPLDEAMQSAQDDAPPRPPQRLPGALPEYDPEIDVVRVEPDGSALIAGYSEPNAQVMILLDGVDFQQVEADGGGNFAALVDLGPSATPQILALEMVLPDGTRRPGVGEVILAPRASVEALADTAPDADGAGTGTGTGTGAAMVSEADIGDASTADIEIASADDVGGDEAGVSDAADTGTTEAQSPAMAESTQDPSSVTSEAEAASIDALGEVTTGTTVTVVPETEGNAEAEASAVAEANADAQADAEVASAQTGSAEANLPATSGAETGSAEEVASSQLPSSQSAETPATATAGDAPQSAAVTDPETEPETAPETASAQSVADAPELPSAIISDADGVRSLSATPQIQGQIVIDAITYDETGEVSLSGRGSSDQAAQIYLDNQPVELAQIDALGNWSIDLPDVDPGTYTLRIDQLSAEGQVSSRVETPFLREEPEVIAALPELEENGVNIVTVQTGNTLWGIARERYGEGQLYVQVFDANRDQIRDPDMIFPGQIFTIPELR